MNVSGQRVQQLFNDLDRRFKYADKKGQSGVRGQEGDGVQKTRTTEHRGPPDTTAITNTGSRSRWDGMGMIYISILYTLSRQGLYIIVIILKFPVYLYLCL